MAELIALPTIKESLTECPICTEQFDEDRRIPRRMPCCVQSICQQCLETYMKGRQTLSCPMCRHQHHIPDGVTSLPKEPVILKILDHLKIQKGLRLPCTDCPDNHTAMAQCDNCGIFLCTECLNAHVRNRVTRNHTTLTFEEMKGRPAKSFRRLHQCTEHQQAQQFYCHTCQKIICVSCTVVEHDKGKGHNVVSLEEAHQVRSIVFDEALTKLDRKVEDLQQTIDELQKKKQNIRISVDKAKLDIRKTFDDLIEELVLRKAILLSELDTKCNEDLKLTEKALDSTKKLVTKVRSSTEYTRKMKSTADKIEELQLITSSADSLKTVLEEAAADVPFIRRGVCFVPAHVDKLSSAIKGTGMVRKITYSAAEKPLYVTSAEVYNAISHDPAEVPEVPYHDDEIAGDDQILCPSLEWDHSTSSSGITISGSEITITEKLSKSESDTGLRIEGGARVLTSRPLVIGGQQRVMFLVKVRFSVKQVRQNTLMFETALTRSPIDCTRSQPTGLSVIIRSCSNHENQLCLVMRYNDRQLYDSPVTKNEVGKSHDLHLCFLLDGNSNKIHVIDGSDVKIIKSLTNVTFDSPLWILMYICHPTRLHMVGELVSGRNIFVSKNLKKCLLSCRDSMIWKQIANNINIV